VRAAAKLFCAGVEALEDRSNDLEVRGLGAVRRASERDLLR
jgi:hypothetical protein